MPKATSANVIIGNSAAAVAAVEAIRKTGNTEPIVLISDEPHPPYSRPLISELLAGQVKSPRMLYRPENFYEKNNVEALLGVRAESIDVAKKSVKLSTGKKVAYKNLLLATGSRPLVPPMEGLELKRVFTFMRWQEAEELIDAAGRIRHAVVIGGGLIGLKAAEALRHIGVEVTLLDLAPRILPMAADPTASAMIEQHLRDEAGIQIITGNTVTKIEGDERGFVKGVTLKSGEYLKTEMVVVAIGVRPNTQLAEGTEIVVRRGFPVDNHMQTNVPHIYAAGDVAEGYDLVTGENRLLPIWPVAFRQGAIAGLNMAGKATEYEGYFAMNSIELFNLPLISMGRLEAPDEPGYETLTRSEGGVYRKIILKDGVIVGALYLKNIDRVGIIGGMIRDKYNVADFKEELLKDDFGWLSTPEDYRADLRAKHRCNCGKH